MHYAIRNLGKRYVHPKKFPAELAAVSCSSNTVTIGLTLCDPRGTGDGKRMYLDLTPADANQPLMAVLLGRVVGMLTPEMYEEFDRVVREGVSNREGRCPCQHGKYDCALVARHTGDHRTENGGFAWARTLSEHGR